MRTSPNQQLHTAPKQQRKFYMFLFFVFLSCIFWLLIKLSGTYSSIVNYKLVYENIPQDKILQNSPSKNLSILITGSGYNILNEKLFDRELHLDLSKNLSFDEKLSRYIIRPSEQRNELQSQRNEVVFERFYKDTIQLDYGKLLSKKIPVSLVQNIQFKPGYHHDGTYKLSPDSVVIKGPEKKVLKFNQINTKVLSLAEVTDSIDQLVLLDSEEMKNAEIEIEGEQIRVEAQVERYTEGVFELDVKVLNVPKNIEITVFPKTVKVYYQTSLSKFNQVKASDFSISADYSKAESLGLNYLDVSIEAPSSIVGFYRCEPNRLEYLIRER